MKRSNTASVEKIKTCYHHKMMSQPPACSIHTTDVVVEDEKSSSAIASKMNAAMR